VEFLEIGGEIEKRTSKLNLSLSNFDLISNLIILVELNAKSDRNPLTLKF
jgi:hypothetical protein